MRRILFTVLGVVASFGLSAQDINFGHGFSESSIHHKAAIEFKNKVEEQTDGQVQVHVFHSGQLGSAREMFEGLQLGSLEMTWVPTARISGFAPQLQYFDLPFVFEDYDELEQEIDGQLGERLLATLEEQGVKGLGFYIDGFKYITTDKPIKTIDDFKGLKFRTMESDIVMQFYRALGADPVPIDYAEVYSALQMGAIDGQENPAILIQDMKFYEVQDNLTKSDHAVLAGVLLANQAWFDELDPEVQEILAIESQNLLKNQRALAREEENKAVQALLEHGLELYELDDSEKAKMKEKTQFIVDGFIEKYNLSD